MRIAPNRLSIDGSVAWPQVFGLRGADEYPKPRHYFNQNDEHNIFFSPPETHRRQRRQLSYAFSEAALKGQEPVIQHHNDLLMEHLAKRADTAETLDIVP